MDEQIKSAFRGLTNIVFVLSDSSNIFVWAESDEKGMPKDRILIGKTESPTWVSPYIIEKLTYNRNYSALVY